ncbi:MAG: TlpA family protein disulfide reductase [Gaiellales bacterium]|nr:MAG: TlpA family protein disulfide reductase [Gaiellales bacterium]
MSEDSSKELIAGGEDNWSLREILVAVAAFAVIVALSIGGYLWYQSTRPPAVVEGSLAPDFTFPLLGGGEASLSDYRGKVVVLNIWATSCETCKEEMPFIEQKYRELNGDDFQLLTISTDKKGEEVVRPFLEDIGEQAFRDPGALTFPVLLDKENVVGDIYQTRKYPESFIIDRDGVVAGIVLGRLEEHDFYLVQEMLAR